MRSFSRCHRVCGLVALIAAVTHASSVVNAVDPLPAVQSKRLEAELPEWMDVDRLLRDYFQHLPGHQTNDLLSRKDVEPLFGLLEDLEWQVRDRQEILGQVLSDSDWMVRTLRSRDGLKFMRSLAAIADGYDRFDRMRQLPEGKRQITALMKEPGGPVWFEFLGSSPLGKQTAELVSRAPQNRKFDQPTHRLYTAQDVYQQFRKRYQVEQERIEKSNGKLLLQQPKTPLQPQPSQQLPEVVPAPAEPPAGVNGVASDAPPATSAG